MYSRISKDRIGLIIIGLISLIVYSCSSDQSRLPEVITNKPSEVYFTSARLNGVVLNGSTNLEDIHESGICFNSSGDPDLNDIVVLDENSSSQIVGSVENLEAGLTYYYRAYAINELGVSFGKTVAFSTPGTLSEAFNKALRTQQEKSFDKGVSAAFIMPDGSIWQGTSGFNDEDLPITSESVFFAGDITMTFVSALMLLLDSEKYVTVNNSYSSYIEAIENCRDDITVSQLLDHTNGLHGFTNEQFYLDRLLESEIVYSPMELLDNFHVAPPYCLPGKQFITDGPGYLLAAMIIESITEQSLLTEMQDRIFSELGLENTYWGGYESFSEDPGGLFFPGPDESHNKQNYKALLAAVYGSENIVSTPTDLALFYRSLGREELLSPDYLAKMMTTSPLSIVPESNGVTTGYGLGLGVRIDEVGDEVSLFHEGDLGNVSSVFYSIKYGISASCMSNNPESSNSAIRIMKKAYEDCLNNDLLAQVDDITVN